MLALAIIIAYIVIGTVIGRVLFRKRLGGSIRYTIENQERYWSGREKLVTTKDHESATIYAVSSIFGWPLTLPVYLVQAPTPQEKEIRRTEELENATRELEAVAKKYDLQLKV